MKQVTGRFLPKNTLSASRRYFAWPPLARISRPVLARHRAWAQVLLGRFALRSARAGRQKLIFRRGPRRGLLSIRNFRKSCLTLPGLSQTLRTQTAIIERAFVERLPSRGLRTVLSSAPYQKKKSPGSLQVWSRSETTVAAGPAPASRDQQQRTMAPAISMLLAVPIIRFKERQVASTRLATPEIRQANQLREKVTIDRAERYEQISETILRKTQRVEDRALASRFGARKLVITPDTELTYSRRSQRLENETTPEPAKASAPVTPVVNVTGLTDEVIKQLDRRLVAAMERLGKT
jgi:hypothetical protein